jgi:hypothetical protein
VDPVQASLGEPVSDGFAAEPERIELAPRDNAMLLSRKPPSVDALCGHSH